MVKDPVPRIPPIPAEWRRFVPAALLDAHEAAVRDYEISAAKNGRAIMMGRWLNVPVTVANNPTPEGRVLRTMEAVARELIEQLKSERVIAFGRDNQYVGESRRISAAAFQGEVNIFRRGYGHAERCFSAHVNFTDRSISFSDPNAPIFYDVRLERPGNAAAKHPREPNTHPFMIWLKQQKADGRDLRKRGTVKLLHAEAVEWMKAAELDSVDESRQPPGKDLKTFRGYIKKVLSKG